MCPRPRRAIPRALGATLSLALVAQSLCAPGCKKDADRTALREDLGPLDASNVKALLARYRGQVVVMNFWAPWCKPCAREMPALAATAKAHRKKGLVLVTVNMAGEGSRDRARAFLDRHGVKPPRFQYAADRLKAFTRALGVTWGGNLPATFVFDRQGTLRLSHLGPLTRKELDAKLRPLL